MKKIKKELGYLKPTVSPDPEMPGLFAHITACSISMIVIWLKSTSPSAYAVLGGINNPENETSKNEKIILFFNFFIIHWLDLSFFKSTLVIPLVNAQNLCLRGGDFLLFVDKLDNTSNYPNLASNQVFIGRSFPLTSWFRTENKFMK